LKAVVLRRPKHLELADIPEPELTSKEHVLIKVEACGICGSDLRYWAGDNPWALHTLGRHVDNPANMVLGHEFAGEVVKVNSAEHEHLLGTRVGVQSFRSCGVCTFCRTGRENLCRDMIHIGHAQGWGDREYFPGAYAEYCIGWADLLHPLADTVTSAEAALADIYCVAMHVVGRTKLYEGAAVLCIGGGPAGLSIAQIAELTGAKDIVLSDPSPMAQKVIREFRYTVIDPSERELSCSTAELLGDRNFAAVFDSVGSAESMTTALGLLEESGTYVNLAVHSVNISLDAAALGSERTLTTSSNAFYRDLASVFELLNARTINVAPLITHRLPLEDYERAFELLLQSPKGAFKIVFEP
jgi:threonine dehydrogenase-like Zn-dependent dehydrogenase